MLTDIAHGHRRKAWQGLFLEIELHRKDGGQEDGDIHDEGHQGYHDGIGIGEIRTHRIVDIIVTQGYEGAECKQAKGGQAVT